MKSSQLNIFIALLFLSFTISSYAQDSIPNVSYTIVASKNGIEKLYKPGTQLFLKYDKGSLLQKVRGFFSGVIDSNIVITHKKKSKGRILIPVEDIILLRKINPGKRIIYGAIGTVLVGGGAAIIDKAGNTPGTAMGGALLIPVIGAGVYFLCAVPVSLLLEKMFEKKVKNGWALSIEQYKIKKPYRQIGW